jgi:hypothetical protein
MRIVVFMILFTLIYSEMTSQQIIEGQVTNIGGGILSAVEVKAKEAPAIFTFTDASGNYRIEVPKEVNYLTFSYSGMQVKDVKIGQFSNINVKLVPINYKKYRFGAGIKFGISNFTLLPLQSQYIIIDSVIKLRSVSLDFNMFYRIKKNFELQIGLEDDLNFGKVNKDSLTETSTGVQDTIKVEENVFLNRLSGAVLINYNMKLDKAGNYSVFIGLGPQFQYFSFLNTGTIGLRIQLGTSINNYGKTIRPYILFDIASGKFGNNNMYVPGLKYDFFSFRMGVSFIF